MKKVIFASAIIASITMAEDLHAQISGIKTIGGTSPDYASFTAAVAALQPSIGGAVTFQVRPGTYTEQITIPYITNVSAANDITFESESGDSTDVILTYSPTGTSDNFTVKLDAAEWITFRNMTLTTGGTEYADILVCENEPDNIALRNNRFIGTSSPDVIYGTSIYSYSDQVMHAYTIRDNLFEYGSMGVYLYGYPGYEIFDIDITGNIFTNQSYSGITVVYGTGFEISDNTIQASGADLYTGIECQKSGSFYVTKNRINLPGIISGRAIFIYNCDGSSGNDGLVANNFIRINCEFSATQCSGIYYYGSTYQDAYHNSVHVTGNYMQSRGINMVSGSSNIQVINNILANYAGGYAIYSDANSGITSDYNDLVTNGTNLGYWYNSNYTSLSSWQSGSGQDNNSISEDPLFFNDSDLHASNLSLQNGLYVSDVPDDIDGETRSMTSPCIGADEFIYGSLAGTYPLGPSAPEFHTFNDAFSALINRGIRGDVLFQVESGTYNERNIITEIPGASSDQTVTFESVSGDSSDVTLNYTPSGSADNGTLIIDGADYITFRNLTISSTGTDYAMVVRIQNGSHHLQFLNNRFKGVVSTGILDPLALVYSETDKDSNNLFQNNRFEAGSYGLYLKGSSSDYETGTTVLGNDFINQYENGIFFRYQEGAVIEGNYLTTITNFAGYSAIYINFCSNGITVRRNFIDMDKTTGGYGLHLYFVTAASGEEGLVANNLINVNTSGNICSGIHSRNSSFQKIFHNNIQVTGILASSSALNLYQNNSDFTIYNNIISNPTGAYAISSNSTTNLVCDYNNLYSSGSYLGSWNAANQADLSAWQSASGQDAGSLSVDPQFSAVDDPHFPNPLLNDAGTPVTEVTIDIDGEARDAAHPDIGADEFCLPPVTADKYGCTGRTIPDLTATGSNIQWYSDEALTTLVHSGSNFPTGHTSVGTYTYYATQTVNGSESQSAETSLTIYTTPGLPGTSDETICFGETTPDLTATGSNIKWYGDETLLDSVYAGPTFPTGETDAGTYVYYVTQTANGCESDGEPATLVINTIPPSPGAMNAIICEGEPLPPLTASGSNIRWYDDEGLTNQVHTGGTFDTGHTEPGDYPYYATQTVLGCESPAAYDTARIKPLPSPPLVWDENICYGGATPLMEASGNGIIWYSDAGLSTVITDTDSSFLPQETAVGRYSYYATQTVNSCEGAPATAWFIIHTLPDATVMDDAVICQADTQYFNIGSAPLTGHSYSWVSDIDGFIGTDSDPSVKPVVTTTYTLTETIDSSGCQDIDAVTITVNQDPAVSILGDQELCESDIHAFQIGETAEGGHTYSWTSDPPGFSSSASNPEIIPPGSITYILTKTILTTGCDIVDSVTFMIHPDPLAQVLEDQTLCRSELHAIDLGADPVAGNTYNWTADRGGFTSYESNPSVTPDSTTTYTLTETVTATGCDNTNSVTITIFPSPEVNVLADQELCLNDSHTFQIGETEEPGNTYYWISDKHGFISDAANPVVRPLESIRYIVTKTTDTSECSIIDTVVFTVNPNPQAEVIDDQAICRSEIHAVNLGGDAVTGNKYEWTADRGGFTSSGSNPSVTPDSTTTYTLTETVLASRCDSTRSVTITINPNPDFTINAGDNPIDIGNSTSLTTSDQSLSYAWDPGTGLSSTSGYQVTASPVENITYHVSGINQYNCEANASIDMMVYCTPCEGNKVLTDTGDFNYGCSVNNLYKNDLNCSWTLYPEDISKIYLYFYPDDFDVMPGDWVVVYDGTQASEDTLGKFNNDNPPSGYIEGGNSMFIQFITDGSVTGSGFQARWSGTPTSVKNSQPGDNLRIYPNPAVGSITIESPDIQESDAMAFLYDNLGRMVLNRELECRGRALMEKIDIVGLDPGIYHLILLTSEGQIKRKITVAPGRLPAR